MVQAVRVPVLTKKGKFSFVEAMGRGLGRLVREDSWSGPPTRSSLRGRGEAYSRQAKARRRVQVRGCAGVGKLRPDPVGAAEG